MIAGIDEAGRGPWAGPVVAACVVLSDNFDLKILKDSKKMNPKQRDEVYQKIAASCNYGIGMKDASFIDRYGIKKATHQAMLEAYEMLIQDPSVHIHKLVIDGNDKFSFPLENECIIKGDEKIPVISAASILAKVWRDKMMCLYNEIYPAYFFAQHKGYGTYKHFLSLKKYSVCPLHRKTYTPIKNILNEIIKDQEVLYKREKREKYISL